MTDPIYHAALEVLDDGLEGLRRAVEGASPDVLNRRPAGDDTNSIVVLVTHALHSTRAWLSLGTGIDAPPRDRPAEFRATAEDTEQVLALVDSMAADCRALLDVDGAFDPGQVGRAPWLPGAEADEPVTASWALLHALEHLGEHAAHAQLTRQVLDAPG